MLKWLMCNRWITKEELLILAESNGYKGITRKFDRWRKADLFARPQRVRLPGKATTCFAYPPETGNQLIALCRLHFGHGPERRLDPLRLALWCEGFDIQLPALRRTLKELFVIPATKQLRQISRTGADALEASELIADAIVKTPLRRGRGIPGTLNRTIKRLGNMPDASSFFSTLFRLSLGDVPEFQADGMEAEHNELSLGQIVERGLGVEAGRVASIAGERPWLADSDLSELNRISKFLKEVSKLIDRASKSELDKTRADWLTFTQFPLIADTIKQQTGNDVFSAELLKEFFDRRSPLTRAGLLCYLLWCRDNGQGTAIDQITHEINVATAQLKNASI